ncbi:MAG: glycosyl hydrolase family 18 protein [Candidatus Weimeria sp.]
MNKSKGLSNNTKWLIVLIVLVAVIAAAAFSIWSVRYAPTKERMSIKSYYGISGDQAALFINGNQIKDDNDKKVAELSDGHFYIELSTVKSDLDEGYVYDSTEKVLRYTTDSEVVSVNAGDTYYTSGRQKHDENQQIILTDSDTTFIALDFVKQFTDITVTTGKNPNRIVIEKAGYKKKAAEITRDTEARRYGGPKSKILADVKKGTKVSVIESYGKWEKILTDDGIEGCVKNSAVSVAKSETVKKQLAARKYNHITMDGKVSLLWHQVTNRTANSSITSVLSNAQGVNVISPTWFHLADNDGGLSDIASLSYVKTAHSNGVQVWALVSNLENSSVDSATVLNTTSSRDNLVNNLIGKAVSYDLDGINVDFEQIPKSAADGYMEFIKELSLKCEANDLVLSVDNYPPTASSSHYRRKVQANYADYCIVMAYDEHYSVDDPGSNASIGFVKDAITNSLKEIPKSRLILGMPFYSKLWETKDNVTTIKTLAMRNVDAYLKQHNVQETWDDTLGQNYAEFSSDGAKIQLWIEDEKSFALKLDAMKSNELAGGAFWKEGQEDSSIWELIGNYMK